MGIFSTLSAKLGLAAGVALVALICLAIIARNWSCRPHKPPRPPREWQCEVISVPNGASIEVKGGLRGRKPHTVALYGIAAPTADPWASASTASLAALCGATCRVVAVKAVVAGGVEVPCSACGGAGKCLPPKEWTDLHPEDNKPGVCPYCNGDGGLIEYGPLEARPPAVGIVYGASGTLLAEAQLAAGLADVVPGAPAEYVKTRDKAKKARVGQWSK
jgi:endonuclease YncB( thermonuclease family)